MGYPVLYDELHMFTHYHNVSGVKLPHEIAFIVQLTVY